MFHSKIWIYIASKKGINKMRDDVYKKLTRSY